MVELNLSSSTKILVLIEEYPFLMDVLIKLNPILKRLKNPILRRTVGKKATIVDVSKMSGIEVPQLLRTIKQSIEEKSNVVVELDPNASGESGWETDEERRLAMLKSLILELHEGGDVKELQNRFKELLGDVDASEIARMEQSLIDEGELTTEQITRLCDLHVGIFEDALDQQPKPDMTPGHPLHTYNEENKVASNLIEQIREYPSPKLLRELAMIEIHYTRLENQLFPKLEEVGFTGPSQVMWAKHDEVRDLLKLGENAKIDEMLSIIEDLIFKEENI
ncbi:MAG: DUF438 domain-containing protein, partial [Candidatus Hodarchaeales archaeon]